MKGCLGLAVIAAAAIGGGYTVYANPALPAQAVLVEQQVADWMHTHIAAVPAAAPAPSASSAPPLALILPSSSPSPLPASTWTTPDCSWASAILARDTQLDQAEAAAVANGTDTRYGTGPQIVAHYQGYADEWSTVLGEVEGACVGGTVPTAAQASDALSWFARATATHQGDAHMHPEDAQWDQDWIGYYARLSTMFAAASQ